MSDRYDIHLLKKRSKMYSKSRKKTHIVMNE